MAEIRQIQVDGVNYDLVISEDEVSATRAEQAAQRAANSATQAASNSAQASEYSNTAREYAQDAQDAADRAEAIVGGQFVSYGQSQSLTDSEKETARTNIGVTKHSNANLLDNWYWVGGGTAGKFPINQRGKNYYAVNDYTIDRWKSVNLYGNGKTVKVATQDGGLVLAGDTESQDSYVQFQQIIANPPYGKEVTLSLLADNLGADDDGNYPQIWYGASAYKNITTTGLTSVTFTCSTDTNENYVRFVLYNGATTASSIRIQAIKLELGSVSTLEQDAAPDYGVELTRCIYSKADPSDTYANNGFGRSNDNLLDNAYFVGGGSQLGDGVFPINQRGQTSYAWSGVTCIDRWYIFSANDTVTLSASGLTVNANENGGVLGQKIKYYPEYSQQPLICTFLTTDNKRIVWSFTINTSISWQGGTLVLNECPDFYVDALYDSASNTVAFVLAKSFDNIPHSIALKAAKLELGTVSTLANDPPPDFGAELAKCQRRLFRVSPMGTSSRGYAGFGSANSSKNILVFVPTPVTLAKQPTVSFSNCNAYNYVAGGSIAISSISIDSWTQNGVFLSCTPSDASQVVQYQPYVLRVAQGGYLQFSAEPL